MKKNSGKVFWLKFFFKLLFVVGILLLLYKNSMIEPASIKSDIVSTTWTQWISVFSLILFNVFTWTFRTQLILKKVTGIVYSKSVLMKMNWSCSFLAMTGFVGIPGEMYRLISLKKIDSKPKKRSLALVLFLDRFYGLIGMQLLTIVSLLVLFLFYEVNSFYKNAIIFLGAVYILGVIFMLCFRYVNGFLAAEKAKYLNAVFSSMAPGLTFKTSLLALMGHWANILALYVLAKGNENAISFVEFLSCTILSLQSTLLSLTPLNVGVGHVAFDYVFRHSGVVAGAHYFNLYLFVILLNSFLGMIPFLLQRSPSGSYELAAANAK